MTQPSEAAIKEAAQLKGGAFYDYLKESYLDTLKRIPDAPDGVITEQLKGRAKQMEHLVAMIDDARNKLARNAKEPIRMNKAF
jgi:hypothetical protein